MIDTATGRIVGSFESGDQPHENNYSADGSKIFHASIGSVFTPTDDPALDDTKGDRWFEIVDARSFKVLKRLDMGQKLEEAGYPNMSSAVRPMALAPDEKKVYFQVSFFHGFVEYDLVQDKVLRLARLPVSDEAAKKPREEYLLDSAHHGLAMNPQGTKLCVAGTMSDYAAIVHRDTFAYRLAAAGQKPYWSTNSRRRPLLLHLLQRRRPRVGRLLRDRARGGERAGRRPPAADADGRAGDRRPRRARRRAGPAGRPAAQAAGAGAAAAACAPGGRCACGCA